MLQDGIRCPQCGQTTTLLGAELMYPFYCPACETFLMASGQRASVPSKPDLTMDAVKEQISSWANTVREEYGSDDEELKRILDFLDRLET